MESNGRRAFHGKNRKFWAALFIFSLMGQVAWVVENMYFNVFIYKMFHATAADISLMVERISDFYRETILPAIPKGVCGCIYTQLSNVEDEVNGLYTYHRKPKMDISIFREINSRKAAIED